MVAGRRRNGLRIADNFRVTYSGEKGTLAGANWIGKTSASSWTDRHLVSATIYAMALQRLSPAYQPGDFNPHDSFLHTTLNEIFGINPPTGDSLLLNI
jgi:hypothetical protein